MGSHRAAHRWKEVREGQGSVAGSTCSCPLPPARYITQQGNKLETGKSRVPPTVTNAVSWRSEGIKYKKNEVFIDVIESVNLLVSPKTFTPPLPRPGGRIGDPLPIAPTVRASSGQCQWQRPAE